MNERVLIGHKDSTCWQYTVRSANFLSDLQETSFTQEYIEDLTCSDFDFKVVTGKEEQQELKKFIEKHEWLGNLSQYTTHWFALYHKEHLAGVLLFNLPNAFSKMLGEDTPQLERLISRGACISWSPKGLASHFIMKAIRWMVDNTPYRLFTAYSDPTAKELGTVYQACGFYYLGKKSGTEKRYINPYTGKLVSDRFFRQRTAYKKYAKELGITWEKEWTTRTGINWGAVPEETEAKLRQASKDKQAKAKLITFPSKHKYALVLGKDKRETRRLKKEFLEKNKTYSYPKERGK